MTDKPLICRSFRQDFPEFAGRAEALGVKISLGEGRRNGRERVFWLDGYRQLTGYTTKSDGSPFRHEDAVRNIDKALTAIEDDRKIMAGLTIAERFARVLAEFREMKPQARMIGEVRLPGGDGGHCFFMADYEGGVHLHGFGQDVARGKAEWRHGETMAAQIGRFCDAIEADFTARAAIQDQSTTCRKCGGQMRPGIATGQTYSAGMPDFPGDEEAVTLSAGGPGKVIEAMKCSKCGWSVTK